MMMPLAARVRPQTLKDYVGQRHLLAEGRIIDRMLKNRQLSSVIFCGEPGVGKTTLARLIADESGYLFIERSAVNAGVKEIKEVVKAAINQREQFNTGTILFVDEIHRFNKAQQDALLPQVENGLICLIGATTENPFFAINNALLSRLTVLRLKPLTQQELNLLIHQALNKDEILRQYQIHFEEGVLDRIYHYAAGDSRKALNLIEAMQLMSVSENGKIDFDIDTLDLVVGEHAHKLDRGGDYFYDQLSAFHKSVRGSDPDAAIFWLANMIESGGDPLVIARRMLCIASEDIGNADPRALNMALDAWQSYERLGLPEGRLPLIQAAIYLSVAPKSNAAYMAYKNVLNDLKNHRRVDVPLHLRNIKPAGVDYDKKQSSYRYPHDYEHAWVDQQYLPDGVDGGYYQPTDRGLEQKIRQKMDFLKSLAD
ncbi:MAG: replication-associated recombination protein A [Francisellaceae bacterium]